MRLNYQQDGDGRAIVVLHGLFGSLGNWKSIARRLAADYRVITVDLRNHGRSPWHDDVSYPAMAGDVAGLIRQQQLDRPLVVGHSMGGKVAMTLALQYPELISGLVAVDIAPVVYAHSHIDLIHTLQQIDLAAIGSRQDLDRALAPAVDDPGLRMFLSQNLVFSDGGYRWRINLAALAAGMKSLTGFPDFTGRSYRGPARFVHGSESDYVLAEHRPLIEALFPEAVLYSIGGAGHWVHAQAPAEVIEQIRLLAG